MSNRKFTRIGVKIDADADRRALCSILAANGLEVRIVRTRPTNRGAAQYFVEYRNTGSFAVTTEPPTPAP